MEENQKPKSNKAIFIIVGILVIVIAALVGYIVFNKTSEKKESASNETTTSTLKEGWGDNVKDKFEYEDKKSKKDSDEEDEEDEEEDENTSSNKNTSKKDKNSTSSFGSKKDKNNTDKNTTDSKTSDSKSSNASLSSDWKSGEFVFDGASYKINDDYQKYVDNGWSVDLSKYGYDNGYILNKNDKTTSTVSLENSKYDKPYVNIGFVNLGEEAKDVTKCQVWGISVDNSSTYHAAIDFELPGGLKYGSSLADVEKAYGKPEDESDIYRSEDLKYTTYTYDSNERNTPQLRLVIYDDKGLVEFDYKQY